MGTAEFHHLVGKYLAEREEQTGRVGKSLLAAAYRCGVPIFTVVAGRQLHRHEPGRAACWKGRQLRIDPLRDVNQSAAIVWDAKTSGGSGVFILGGGSPKNFMLQTEPQIQEVLGPGGERARLLPAVHRRPPRHRRPERGDAAARR